MIIVLYNIYKDKRIKNQVIRMKTKKKSWYKLDNAAKIFPPTTDKYDTKTFRFSVFLTEEIDSEKLQEALDSTIKDFPIFRSKLQKGFFWYYLEESEETPTVELEHTIPCDDREEELLFKVMYFKKRISVEVSHELTDATGTLSFLKCLTANYLNIIHNLEKNPLLDTSSIDEKSDDSYNKYYQKSTIKRKKVKESAYHLKGETFPEGRLKIIEGKTSTKGVLSLAKKYDTTLTIYLTALLIESIGKNMTLKERQKPIYITVPVNLRNYFPSSTVRNFFGTITICYKYQEQPLEDIIENMKVQFKEALTKEKIAENMNNLAALEKVFLVRIVPRIIKDIVLKIGYQISTKSHTISLSNIGKIEVPEEYKKYIEYFEVFSSTDGMQVCLCSYEDALVISFSSHFINSQIERNFFCNLTNQNLKVIINTNSVEEEENDEVL